MPGPEPNAAEDPKGWLAWYNEQQAANNTSAAKPAAGGTPATGARLPNTGTQPVAAPYGSVKLADISGSTREIPGSGGVRINQLGFTYTPGSDGTYRVSTGYSTSANGRQQVPAIWGGAAQGMTNTGQNQSPLSSAIGNSVTGTGPTTAQGVVQQSLTEPTARQYGGMAGVVGTLGPTNSPQLPGFENFQQPGIGIPEAGRTQMNTGTNGLNTLIGASATGNHGNGPQIQAPPAGLRPDVLANQRNSGGVSMNFGGAERGGTGSPSTVGAASKFDNIPFSVDQNYTNWTHNQGPFTAGQIPFNTGSQGAGLLQLSGPQTAEIRGAPGSGVGFGFNPTMYGPTFGRNLSDDPATKAVEALALMTAQQNLVNNGLTPQSALAALNTPDQGAMSGSPGSMGYGSLLPQGANGPLGAAQAAQSPSIPGMAPPAGQPNYGQVGQGTAGAGNAAITAGQTIANGVAPSASSPFGGIPGAGAAPAPSGVPNDKDGDGVPDFAKGATVTMGRFSKAPVPFAVGGTVKQADPYAGTSGMTAASGAQAPVAAGETAPERYTQQPQTTESASQAGLSQMANSAPAQNSAGIFASPTDYSAGGRGVNDSSGATSAGATVASAYQPTATSSPEDIAQLSPFLDASQRFAGMDRARAQQGSLYSRAGLAAPQGTPFLGDNQQNQLGPGQYTDYGSWLNSFLKEAQSKQNQVQQLGGANQDTSNATLQQNLINQQMAPWQQANELALKRAGLGQVGDPAAIQEQINQLKSQAGPIATISDAQQKLTALGQPIDVYGLPSQISALEEQLSALNGSEGTPYGQQQIPALQSQIASLKNSYSQGMAQNNAIQQQQAAVNNLMQSAGLTQEQLAPAMAQYQAQIDAQSQQLKNAQEAANYTSSIGNLTGGLTDLPSIAGKISGYQQQLLPFTTQLQNAQQAGQIYSQLQNQLKTPVPHFAKGAKLVTPEQIDLVGKSGKVYGTMGEPHYPGGPNMKERVTFPGKNRMKITPLNKPAPPLGKFSRKKVAA